MNRKVTELLSYMPLMYRPAEVSDFAFRLVATKLPVSGGRFRARTARSDHLFFAFRHVCERETAPLRLVSRVLGLGRVMLWNLGAF
jgi:hypothetical protein